MLVSKDLVISKNGRRSSILGRQKCRWRPVCEAFPETESLSWYNVKELIEKKKTEHLGDSVETTTDLSLQKVPPRYE